MKFKQPIQDVAVLSAITKMAEEKKKGDQDEDTLGTGKSAK